MTTLGPRIVVAGTHSGVGKTTIATGLMRALVARGVRVAAAKVGADFIDPGYHRLATGRPGVSLDAFLSGESLLPGLAAQASRGADLLIVEGVMGLFDGTGEKDCDGSTAAVGRLLEAPIVLVVDVSAMSGSVAAIVHGFASLDPAVRVAGVVLNRVGDAGHESLLREALDPLGISVLGALFVDEALQWRERHLGLVPVAEQSEAVRASITRLGELISRSLDLESLVALARSAPRRDVADPQLAMPTGRCRIAVCGGAAFSFIYQENLDLLVQAGAELADFDPLLDEELPEGCNGLYAGGGFREVYAARLGENERLLREVRQRVGDGMPTWAECGGFLWLCETLDGIPMAGVLPNARVTMTERLTIGYRLAATRTSGIFGPAGVLIRGHEFHHSEVDPAGTALHLEGRFGSGRAGYSSPTLFASYLHQHLSATPEFAERFVALSTPADELPLPKARR